MSRQQWKDKLSEGSGVTCITFFVFGYFWPLRQIGTGEPLCGGLTSGAQVGGASGSGAEGASPSSVSPANGSKASPGDPGGRSEQALAVRVRRLCWPMCVRFLEKLFLCLLRLTLAGFWPGSSFTVSSSGWTFQNNKCQCFSLLICQKKSTCDYFVLLIIFHTIPSNSWR